MSDIDLESNIGGANYDINDYSQGGRYDNLIGEDRIDSRENSIKSEEEGEGMIDADAAEMYSCMDDDEEPCFDEAEHM